MRVGFFGLLAVLFIGLKLGGVIAWGWLWVLAPLWLPFGVFLVFSAALLFGAVCLDIAAFAARAKREHS